MSMEALDSNVPKVHFYVCANCKILISRDHLLWICKVDGEFGAFFENVFNVRVEGPRRKITSNTSIADVFCNSCQFHLGRQIIENPNINRFEGFLHLTLNKLSFKYGNLLMDNNDAIVRVPTPVLALVLHPALPLAPASATAPVSSTSATTGEVSKLEFGDEGSKVPHFMCATCANYIASHNELLWIATEKELTERHNIWLNEELTAKVDSLKDLPETYNEADMSAKLADAEKRDTETSSSFTRNKVRAAETELKSTSLQENIFQGGVKGAIFGQVRNIQHKNVGSSKFMHVYCGICSDFLGYEFIGEPPHRDVTIGMKFLIVEKLLYSDGEPVAASAAMFQLKDVGKKPEINEIEADEIIAAIDEVLDEYHRENQDNIISLSGILGDPPVLLLLQRVQNGERMEIGLVNVDMFEGYSAFAAYISLKYTDYLDLPPVHFPTLEDIAPGYITSYYDGVNIPVPSTLLWHQFASRLRYVVSSPNLT